MSAYVYAPDPLDSGPYSPASFPESPYSPLVSTNSSTSTSNPNSTITSATTTHASELRRQQLQNPNPNPNHNPNQFHHMASLTSPQSRSFPVSVSPSTPNSPVVVDLSSGGVTSSARSRPPAAAPSPGGGGGLDNGMNGVGTLGSLGNALCAAGVGVGVGVGAGFGDSGVSGGLGDARKLGRAFGMRVVRAVRRGQLPFMVVFFTCVIIFFTALTGVGYVDPETLPHHHSGEVDLDAPEIEFMPGRPVFDAGLAQAGRVMLEEEARREGMKKLEEEWKMKKRPKDGLWMKTQRDQRAVRRKPLPTSRQEALRQANEGRGLGDAEMDKDQSFEQNTGLTKRSVDALDELE